MARTAHGNGLSVRTRRSKVFREIVRGEGIFAASLCSTRRQAVDSISATIEPLLRGFIPCSMDSNVADNGHNRVYRICRTNSTGAPEVAAGGAGTAARDGGDIASVTATPNPSRGATRIEWTLRRDAAARVTVYDLAGRVVRRLGNGANATERANGGAAASRVWDGRDESGRAVAAGVYMVRVETDRDARAARVTLLR